MRCEKCKVDLGEEYKRCPLCASPAERSEPVIKGQRTAEYPDVVYKKNPPWYFGIYTAAALALSAIAVAADCAVNKNISNAMWVVLSLPCLWALVFRPIFIKKLYFGSYIIRDIICLSLIMLWYSKSRLGYFGPAIRFGIPLLHLAAALVIVAGIFAFPKRRVNAAEHLMVLGSSSFLLLIINMANGYGTHWCAAAAAVCFSAAAVLARVMSKEICDKLAARFNV
jgi:hypothetical protein